MADIADLDPVIAIDWVDRGSGNESAYSTRPASAVARLVDRLSGVADKFC